MSIETHFQVSKSAGLERSEPAENAHFVLPQAGQTNQIPEKPKNLRILLTATLRWPIASRLAMSFVSMGCQVEVICPVQDPASKTRAVSKTHRHSRLRPLASLRAAIEAARPDLIVPCDDNAAIHLHQLYETCRDSGPAGDILGSLIARSLGNPAAATLATQRGRFMSLAGEESRVPKTVSLSDPSQLESWIAEHTFPAVMKIDCTWGGEGVFIVRDKKHARRLYSSLVVRPPISRAIVRTLLERDLSFILNSIGESRREVVLQQFIAGSPANRAVACWQGTVLAGISVVALKTQHATGPATVVRVIENAEMSEAAIRLVRRLGLTGFWGLDFVLEASTGQAYLIELNPRATPICHLALGAGQNLTAAVMHQMTGIRQPLEDEMSGQRVIALFPGEWRRDHSSTYLHAEFEDVPWSERALVQECMSTPWSERGLLARLWSQVRPSRAQASQTGSAEDDLDTVLPADPQ